MNKNQANLFRFPMQDPIGKGVTGLTPTAKLSKDGSEFVASTNSITEADATNAPGLYQLQLTQSECNCDLLSIQISLPNGEWAAQCYNLEMSSAGGSTLTAQEVWEYATRTLTASALTAQDVWEYETRTLTASALTAADVWQYETRTLTASPTDITSLATAADLATVDSVVDAIKAKTDNLPQSPAAAGGEMALTSAAVSAIQSGLATGTNVSNAQAAIINRGNEAWKTADVAGALLLYGAAQKSDVPSAADNAAAVNVGGVLSTYGAAKTSDVPTAEAVAAAVNVSGALTSYGAAKTSDVPTAEDIWTYPDRELTSEIVIGISAQNIKDITDSVWDAPDRTLTDLKPKPNGKNIVCTPTNVTNAYGVPRLENWTNETSGTTAFDEKIETYITLAKEKMATDLNDHINAAIDYIGADNITELCAWLTGYNLYKDDESTDTDSLPETRYNQYLEQIHRIMENI